MSQSPSSKKDQFILKLADLFLAVSRPEDLEINEVEHLQNVLNRRDDLADKGLDGAYELLDKAGWLTVSDDLDALVAIDKAMTIARKKLALAP